MEKIKIKFGQIGEDWSVDRYISFDILSYKHSISIKVDQYIFKNIDFEINYWKKYNVVFTNIDDIKFRCADHLLYYNKISLETYEYLIKDNTSKFINWYYFNKPDLTANDNIKVLNENSIIKTYIMKDDNTGFYKIGKSINPKFREQTLQSEKPTIKIVKIWEKNIEKELHNLYKSFRIRGEWFDLSKIQVKYICTNF